MRKPSAYRGLYRLKSPETAFLPLIRGVSPRQMPAAEGSDRDEPTVKLSNRVREVRDLDLVVGDLGVRLAC